MKAKGAFTYDVSKILANVTPPPLLYTRYPIVACALGLAREQRYLAYNPLPMSATVSIERPPVMTTAFARPPISKRHKFFKEPPTQYTY